VRTDHQHQSQDFDRKAREHEGSPGSGSCQQNQGGDHQAPPCRKQKITSKPHLTIRTAEGPSSPFGYYRSLTIDNFYTPNNFLQRKQLLIPAIEKFRFTYPIGPVHD
jgi:hypothetical protein